MSNEEEKKRYIREYIRSLNAIELAMEPFKEQKRDLRNEFRENSWLNTDELRAAVKAYRLFKGKYDLDEVVNAYNVMFGDLDPIGGDSCE